MRFLVIFLSFALLLNFEGDVSANQPPFLWYYEYLPWLTYFRNIFETEFTESQRLGHVLINKMCPGHENDTNLKHVMEKFSKCSRDAINLNKTFCHTVNHEFKDCTKPVITALERCTDVNMKRMPEFFGKEILSVTDKVCKLKGEDILELMHPCLLEVHLEITQEIETCKEKIVAFKKSQKPSVEETCNFLEDFKPCIEDQLKNRCATRKTREVVLELFEAAEKPCRDFKY